MALRKVPVDSLYPLEGNPRKHSPEQIDKIIRSFSEFGWTNPILATPTGMVIAGHARLEAAKKAGIKEVPVIFLPLDGQKAKAYAIADNELTLQGEWDFSKLADLLVELDTGDFNLELTGFDMKEIEEIMNWTPEEVKEEEPFNVEEEVEKIKESKTKRGDIYQLGRHRLMCGDARVKEDVEELMNGKKADMVFTDPPYGVDYGATNNKRYKKRSIEGDKPASYQDILKFIPLMKLYLKNSFYIFGADKTIERLILGLKTSGAHISCLIIWAKDHPVLGMGDYNSQHELLVYGWFCDKHKFYGDHTQKTLWEIKRPIKSELHPTQKPIELCSKAIKNSSKKYDIVLDLFGGSGSTLIACEQTGRICYMMEIDPVYCDVIVNRWERYTGEKAKLVKR